MLSPEALTFRDEALRREWLSTRAALVCWFVILPAGFLSLDLAGVAPLVAGGYEVVNVLCAV